MVFSITSFTDKLFNFFVVGLAAYYMLQGGWFEGGSLEVGI